MRALATSVLSGHLLATNFGSPSGVTSEDRHVIFLWRLTYGFAIPLGVLVLGLIIWCVVRYRARPGSTRRPAQFQYHIPLEVTYTVVPIVIVAIVFGFMFGAENKIDAVSPHPAVKIEVQAFQWGWRFIYPNGHQETGSTGYNLDINSTAHLPVLYMPADETVQLHLVTEDVVHGFYVPAFLFQRDIYQGVNETFDLHVLKTGTYYGECNELCGVYHAYMRFQVKVLPVAEYNSWYAAQPANSIHYA